MSLIVRTLFLIIAFAFLGCSTETETTVFPPDEPQLARKLRLTESELNQIQAILAKKSDLVIRLIGRNSQGDVEAWMGYREELPKLTHGPVYFLEKDTNAWVESSEMSEWNENR